MAGSALGFLGDLPGAGIVTGMVDKMDRFDELPAGDQALSLSVLSLLRLPELNNLYFVGFWDHFGRPKVIPNHDFLKT